MSESKLKSALIAALEDPRFANDKLREASREMIESTDEAELVIQLLKLPAIAPNPSTERMARSPLQYALRWMQRPKNEGVATVFRNLGGPELLRIFDENVRETLQEYKSSSENDPLFLLKIICIYAPTGGLERLVSAARSPSFKDGYLWSGIFRVLSNEKHPWQTDAVEILRDPLPDGFRGMAYLDMCNALARDGKLNQHPFDTEPGLAMLQGWMADLENPSYAHSCAASIPFLSPRARQKVQALADQHPDRGVQLEAAWAAAACGESSGYQKLVAACMTPQEASTATHYLIELGAEDRIPPQAKSDDFQAISEMCRWLAHPMEFGASPQEIHQVDSRELFWPPTNDRRKLWVFHYKYPLDGEGEQRTGHGMVGSTTFALFGEATSDLSAKQIYGLHCAWELEKNRDPRAPKKRSAEAGIEILKEYNPDFGQP